MCKLVVSVVIGLLFFQTAASDTSKPFVEPATGIVFPPQLGKWERGQDRDYGPGYGVSIAYHPRPGTTATIYIYNLGLKTIPDGTASQTVQKELAETKSEMAEFWKKTGISGAQILDREDPLGPAADAIKVLRVSYLVTNKDGSQEISEALLTGYKNQFLKLRLTYPKDNWQTHVAEVKALLGDLNDLLKK